MLQCGINAADSVLQTFMSAGAGGEYAQFLLQISVLFYNRAALLIQVLMLILLVSSLLLLKRKLMFHLLKCCRLQLPCFYAKNVRDYTCISHGLHDRNVVMVRNLSLNSFVLLLSERFCFDFSQRKNRSPFRLRKSSDPVRQDRASF